MTVLLALATVLLVPGLLLLRDGRVTVPRTVILGAAAAAIVLLALGVVRQWPLTLAVLGAAMAATSVILLAVTVDRPPSARTLGYALVIVGVVQLPLAFSSFDPAGLVSQLGALDFAGALVFGVPVGAALLAWARVRPAGVAQQHPSRGVWLGGVLAAVGLVLVAIAAETVIDSVTARILLACALSGAAGSAGWMVTRLAGGCRLRAQDAVYGALAGLVSALAGSAWVATQWSLVMGVASGALSAILYGSALRRVGQRPAALGATLLMGGAVGTVLLGLFTDGTGLVHTGGVVQVAAQLGATIVTVAWAVGVSFAVAFALKPRAASGAGAGSQLSASDAKTPGEPGVEVGDTGLEPMTSSV